MAVGAFPAAKLGLVLIKQISKPIANGIASRAQKSKVFREFFCIPIAQLFHWYDVKVRMRVLNLGKVTSVPKLNEKKAIETGAQLLSEIILIGIGSAIVIWEYRRSSAKDEAKAEAAEREKEEVRGKITDLEFIVARQSVQIKELTRLTISIRDDIQKISDSQQRLMASGQKKGWFSGKTSDEDATPSSATTVAPIPEVLQFDSTNDADMSSGNSSASSELKVQDVSFYRHGSVAQAVRELNLHAA